MIPGRLRPRGRSGFQLARAGRWLVAAALALVVGVVLARYMMHERKVVAITSAIENGRLAEASAAIERWLESEPRSADAHFLAARLAWARQDLATVDREIGLARALGHSPAEVNRLWGLLLARGDQKTQAENLLRETLKSTTVPDPEVSEALARLYLGSYRLHEAAALLDDWARREPQNARPVLLRAEADLRLGTPAETVIERYREALRRDPSLDRARLGLAEQLWINKHYDEASHHYWLYLETHPDDLQALIGAGETDLELGEFQRAARRLDRAVTLAPRDPVALAARAALEERQGRFADALAFLDRAIAADPFDTQASYRRSVALASLGRRTEAEAERSRFEKLKADHEQFVRLSQELREHPNQVELRARAAVWLMQHGHAAEALDWARLILASQPNHPAINRMLADYYKSKGELGLANLYEAQAAASSKSQP